MEKKTEVIIVPKEMFKIRKQCFELRFKTFYQRIFPNFVSEKINLLSDNAALTFLALSGALQNSFQKMATDYIDQYEKSNKLFSPSSWDLYKELHPQITKMKAVGFLVKMIKNIKYLIVLCYINCRIWTV